MFNPNYCRAPYACTSAESRGPRRLQARRALYELSFGRVLETQKLWNNVAENEMLCPTVAAAVNGGWSLAVGTARLVDLVLAT